MKLIITTLVRKSGGAPEVRLGGRRTPSQLVTSSKTCLPTIGNFPAEEVIQVAESTKPNNAFAKSLLIQPSPVCEYLAIVTPRYGDWDEVITFEAFTVEDHFKGIKSVYVKFPRTEGWLHDDLTTALVALIELAEGILDCDSLFVCMERDMKHLGSLVHSLMYVGFSMCEERNHFGSNYLVMEYETEE